MGTNNAYPDLSGISTTTENPYDALLDLCQNDPALIQERYETHRQTRNAQQRSRMLSPDFLQLDIDQTLHKLVYEEQYPGFKDTRHCLVFWTRPSEVVKDLIGKIQDELREITPNFWFMPRDNLHMTTLEITHSLTEPEITARVEKLTPKMEQITDYTIQHQTRLIHPLISFDASAIALSFVPATDNLYTYHHLRKEVYELCKSTGTPVESRYVVPSAHLTIGRFVDYKDVGDPESQIVVPTKVKKWIAKIEEINARLKDDYWDKINPGSEWMVGQEKGLDCNRGTLWYGNGQRIRLGKGY